MQRIPSFSYLYLLLALCGSVSLSAQQIRIEGMVTDLQGKALSGEVVVKTSADSTLILVAEFLEGKILLSNLPSVAMNLHISAEGYSDTLLTLVAPSPNVNLGSIRLAKLYRMPEVTVEFRKPFFEQIPEGTRLNVANTMLGASSSVTELLSKVPKVSVSANKISVFGSGDALLYVDGEQIPTERMNSIPVSQISAIEILTNPSARYDASGRAVLNIVLAQSGNQGLQCLLEQNLTMARHFLSYSNVGLDYRRKALSLSAGYNINLGTDWTDNIYSTEYDLPSGKDITSGRSTENTQLANVSTYRIGAEYALTDNSSLSLQYDGLYSLYHLGVSTNSTVTKAAGDTREIHVFNNGQTKNTNNSLNANYNHSLDTLGSSLFVAAQYNNFVTKLFDQITENISITNRTADNSSQALRVNDGTNDIGLLIMQADVSKKLSPSEHLDIGAKYYDIINESRITFRTRTPEESTWTELEQYANSFRYRERVFAMYAQYVGSLSSMLDYKIGVRGDVSSVEGVSRKLGKTLLDTSYINYYPNAALTLKASDEWKATISYSRRISRPIYQDIDPFLWYLDSLTSVQGNPALVPELVHSAEARVSYLGYSLKLGFAASNNALRSNIKSGNAGENSIIYYRENIQSYRQYVASLELPLQWGEFSSYNNLSCTLFEFQDTRLQFVEKGVKPQFYLYTLNTLPLPGICRIELSAEYYSPLSDGITNREQRFCANLGLSRGFFNEKLNVQLMYSDIAGQQRFQGTKTVGVISSSFNQRSNSHFVRLSVAYSFGALSEPNYNNRAINDTEYNRIKQ